MTAIVSFKKKNEKGFSLVELIIVIAIMVILLSALVPAVLGYIEKAERMSALNTAKVLVDAMEVSLVEHSHEREVYLNKEYKYTHDTEFTKVGCLSSYFCSLAQEGTTYGKNNKDYADYIIAQEIMEACRSGPGEKNPYIKIGKAESPLGKTVGAMCPNGTDAVIFAYTPAGSVLYAQVCIKGRYLVTYEEGKYTVVRANEATKFVGTDKIKKW